MVDTSLQAAFPLNHTPRRVVSLVPSLTESLFDLGFGDTVVGITDYCTQPEAAVQALPRLGGPKNPRLKDILALQPDLVLANQEENTRQTVVELERQGVPVWVSFPRTVHEALDVLRTLASAYQSRLAVTKIESLQRLLDWQEAAVQEKPRLSYFCPIWQDTTANGVRWWMTFNDQTYAASVLSLAGGRNAFAERERKFPLDADLGLAPAVDPGQHDTRYPRLTLEEIRSAQPEVILLPSEPFAFEASHQAELEQLLADTPAVQLSRVHRVDGSLITWHGTRLAKAIQELPVLFS